VRKVEVSFYVVRQCVKVFIMARHVVRTFHGLFL